MSLMNKAVNPKIIIAAIVLLLVVVVIFPYGKVWILTELHGEEMQGASYVSWIEPGDVCDCKVYSYSKKNKAKVLLVLGGGEHGVVEWLEWDETQNNWSIVREQVQWSSGGNACEFQWPLYYIDKYGNPLFVLYNLMWIFSSIIFLYMLCALIYYKTYQEKIYKISLGVICGAVAGLTYFLSLWEAVFIYFMGTRYLRLLKRNFSKTIKISVLTVCFCLILEGILHFVLKE